MSELTCQAASGAASHNQRLPLDACLRLRGGVDDQSGRKPRAFLRRYRPRLAKPLPGSIGNSVDLGRVQRVGGDRQSSSKRVEKYEERLPPLVRGGDTKRYRPVLEGLVVSSELVEPDVMSADQAQVFQARIGESPTTPLIRPHTMCNHPRERALGIDQARTLRLRIRHPFLAAASIGCRKPRVCCTRRPKSSSASPSTPSFRIAASVAARNSETRRKSLKWPACSAASCRLSVNPSSLRLSTGTELAAPITQRRALDTSRVVPELRPFADGLVSLLISRAWLGG